MSLLPSLLASQQLLNIARNLSWIAWQAAEVYCFFSGLKKWESKVKVGKESITKHTRLFVCWRINACILWGFFVGYCMKKDVTLMLNAISFLKTHCNMFSLSGFFKGKLVCNFCLYHGEMWYFTIILIFLIIKMAVVFVSS